MLPILAAPLPLFPLALDPTYVPLCWNKQIRMVGRQAKPNTTDRGRSCQKWWQTDGAAHNGVSLLEEWKRKSDVFQYNTIGMIHGDWNTTAVVNVVAPRRPSVFWCWRVHRGIVSWHVKTTLSLVDMTFDYVMTLLFSVGGAIGVLMLQWCEKAMEQSHVSDRDQRLCSCRVCSTVLTEAWTWVPHNKDYFETDVNDSPTRCQSKWAISCDVLLGSRFAECENEVIKDSSPRVTFQCEQEVVLRNTRHCIH